MLLLLRKLFACVGAANSEGSPLPTATPRWPDDSSLPCHLAALGVSLCDTHTQQHSDCVISITPLPNCTACRGHPSNERQGRSSSAGLTSTDADSSYPSSAFTLHDQNSHAQATQRNPQRQQEVWDSTQACKQFEFLTQETRVSSEWATWCEEEPCNETWQPEDLESIRRFSCVSSSPLHHSMLMIEA